MIMMRARRPVEARSQAVDTAASVPVMRLRGAVTRISRCKST